MSFNEDELIKIKNAISGWFKKSARETVTNSLLEMIKIKKIKEFF